MLVDGISATSFGLAVERLSFVYGYHAFSVVSAIALACTALAGCTSSSGIDSIMPQPSAELTSSVVRPSAPLTEMARAPQSMPSAPQEEVLAGWSGS